MKNKIKQSKGITLIALVITIIVLLILAGVTLNIVLNSGIINKSQTATAKYNEQAIKEKLTLALTEYKFKQLAGETPDLAIIISNIGGDLTATTDTEWTIELDGFIFTVDKKTNEIKSIEPSNTKPLAAPEILSTINYADDHKSATIEVTVTAKNGGTISVTIDNQAIIQENGKYTLVVNTNKNIEVKATETVEGRTKTAIAIANVDQIETTKYTVTLTQDSGISAVNGGGEIEEGKNTQISATVEDGKVFAEWVVTSGNADDVADLKANPTTVTPTSDITIKATGATIMPTPTAETGYVGCYADFDGNPGIDGIIYADLLVAKPESGKWNNDNDATFTIQPSDFGLTAENVKSYVVSSTPVVDSKFDSTARYVVSTVAGNTSEKKDRFYVMGLEDIIVGANKSLYWYKNAYGNMSDYSTATSLDFGAGKNNTATILAKCKPVNEGGYGAQDDRDLWKWINVGTGQVNEGWFVPSRGEWAAFAKALNISSSSTDATYYENFKLGQYYWSSSQYNNQRAWTAYFNGFGFDDNVVSQSYYVRLSTTF